MSKHAQWHACNHDNYKLPSRWIQVFFDVDNNITTMKPTKIIDTSSSPNPTGVGEATIIFQDKQKHEQQLTEQINIKKNNKIRLPGA